MAHFFFHFHALSFELNIDRRVFFNDVSSEMTDEINYATGGTNK